MPFIARKKNVYYIVEKYRSGDAWKSKWIRLGKITREQAKEAWARYESDKTYLRLEMIGERDRTIAELIDEYKIQATTIKSKSPITLRAEANKLDIFKRKFGDKNISKLDPEEVSLWFSSQKYQYNTARLHLQAIRAVYRYAINRKYINKDPTINVRKPKEIKRPPKSLDPQIVEAALALMSEESRRPYLIMYMAGLRPSECLRLRVENIDLTRRIIDMYPDQTKTATRGILPMHDRLVPVLEALIAGKRDGDHLFPGKPVNGKKSHQKEAKGALIRAAKNLGLKITPYQLRHTFATRILEATGNIRVAQQLLRHTNIAMTTRYATAGDESLRDAVKKL